MEYAYYNGSYLPYDEIRIPLTDRAVFFGDGVYECIIGGGGKIYEWDEHAERLRKNSEKLRLMFSDFALLKSVTVRLIELSALQRYVIYIQLTRALGRRTHADNDFGRTNLLVTVTELPPFDFGNVSLISQNDIRYEMCNIKTLNLIPSVLASHDALLSGADECVFVRDGIVTECAHSNIFIIVGNRLITHPSCELILPGITREALMKTARAAGFEVQEHTFSYDALFTADEVLITSTTRLARRACEIDKIPTKMSNAYAANLLMEKLYGSFIDFCC